MKLGNTFLKIISYSILNHLNRYFCIYDSRYRSELKIKKAAKLELMLIPLYLKIGFSCNCVISYLFTRLVWTMLCMYFKKCFNMRIQCWLVPPGVIVFTKYHRFVFCEIGHFWELQITIQVFLPNLSQIFATKW